MQTNLETLAWLPVSPEMLFVALFGLLIFGKRMPEVAKSLSKNVIEFKKGLHDIDDEINNFRNGPPPSGFGALSRLSFHTKKSAKKSDKRIKDEKDKDA